MAKAKPNLLKRRTPTDVVGLALGHLPEGKVAAVRLQTKGGKRELLAAAVIDLPGALPADWENARKAITWSLPPPFQSPHAALVATAPEAMLRLTQRQAPAADAQAQAVNGQRQAVKLAMPPDLCLEASLPEYQVLWLSRLLPEGHQPTACSIQVAQAALLNAPLAVPEFERAGGTAVVLIVEAQRTLLVAYQQNRPVLVREQALGNETVTQALASGLGIEPALLQSMIEEQLVDPLPLLEPVLQPLFRQIGLAVDYVAQRFEGAPTCGLLFGVPAHLAPLWLTVAERSGSALTLAAPTPLAGFTKPRTAAPASAEEEAALWPAIGGALAVLEEARDE